MGWVWEDRNDYDANDDTHPFSSSSGGTNPYAEGNSGRCATRKLVGLQCRTEEVEPGKFIRKCEKTEQVFKDCVGRESEMIQSNKEYTEEDVTDQMTKGSFTFESAEDNALNFPGLRSDIEAIERNFFDGIGRFFQAAEEMKNDFFNFVRFPHAYDNDSPSHEYPKQAFPKRNSDGDVDLSSLARDV